METFLLSQMYFNMMILTCNINLLLKLKSQVDLNHNNFIAVSNEK